MVANEYTIALASGELGKFFESYLKRLDIPFDINGPQTWIYEKGPSRLTFRVMRSQDIIKAFSESRFRYDFGMTGLDICENALMEERDNYFKILNTSPLSATPKNLNGKLVLYRRKGSMQRNPLLFTTNNYINFAKKAAQNFGAEIFIREGKLEGYLSSGEADLAIDTLYTGETKERENAANGNKIEVCEVIMPFVYPVVIGCRKYTLDDFTDILNPENPY